MRKVCCKAAIAPQDSRIEKMPTPTIQKMNVFPFFLVKGYLVYFKRSTKLCGEHSWRGVQFDMNSLYTR